MPKPFLECRQLACERDGRLLFNGLDLSIGAGDIVQIEGPNGCGKTTLLRMLTTLLPNYQGEILWQGRCVQQDRLSYLSKVLFVGHLPAVKKNLSPRENLQFLMGLHGSVSNSAIDQALADIGLYGYEDMLGYQLSAGQLRRVNLARLYLSQAPVWVLDEPYTAIDKQGVDKLENLLFQHAANGGCVILTSHQPPAIANLSVITLCNYAPASVDGVWLT